MTFCYCRYFRIVLLLLCIESCRENRTAPQNKVQDTQQWLDFRSNQDKNLGTEVIWVAVIDSVYGSQNFQYGYLLDNPKMKVLLYYLPKEEELEFGRGNTIPWSKGIEAGVLPKVVKGDRINVFGVFTGLTNDGRCMIATTFAQNLDTKDSALPKH